MGQGVGREFHLNTSRGRKVWVIKQGRYQWLIRRLKVRLRYQSQSSISDDVRQAKSDSTPQALYQHGSNNELHITGSRHGRVPKQYGCMWDAWPAHKQVTMTSARHTECQDLHGRTTGFMPHTVFPYTWFQSPCHLAKYDKQAGLKIQTENTGMRSPLILASLPSALPATLPLTSTWLGIKRR